MWLGSLCSSCLVRVIFTVKFLQGKFQPFYQVQYIWSVSIHPNPAFLYAPLRRDQMKETRVPLLSKTFRAEAGRFCQPQVLTYLADWDLIQTVSLYNQLALRFLMFKVFSFLRWTRLILSSFEVPQWVPLWWPGSRSCFALIFYSRHSPVLLWSPLNIGVFQRSSDWALPLQDNDAEGMGTCWLRHSCSWEQKMWFCSKDGLSKGNTARGAITLAVAFAF